MTCKQLGGPCDQKLSAESWDEMVQKMTKHVMSNHPETAEAMNEDARAGPEKVGTRNEAEMGCGSGSVIPIASAGCERR